MWRTPLDRLRSVGFIEALSFILLVGIAMPLKYAADIPEAVSWAGALHGFLFVLYCVTLLHALLAKQVTFLMSVVVFIAAFLPFGPFLVDRKLKKSV